MLSLNEQLFDRRSKVQTQNFLAMKDIFAICKNIFVTALGLICSMEINNRVRFVIDVLDLLTIGMDHARANRNET